MLKRVLTSSSSCRKAASEYLTMLEAEMGLCWRSFQLTRRQELARRWSWEVETSTLERTVSIMLTARQKTSGAASSWLQTWSSQAARLSLCEVPAMAPHVTAELQQDTGLLALRAELASWLGGALQDRQDTGRLCLPSSPSSPPSSQRSVLPSQILRTLHHTYFPAKPPTNISDKDRENLSGSLVLAW